MIIVETRVINASPPPKQYKTFLNDKDCILLAANPIAKNEVIAKKEPIFARILKEEKQS